MSRFQSKLLSCKESGTSQVEWAKNSTEANTRWHKCWNYLTRIFKQPLLKCLLSNYKHTWNKWNTERLKSRIYIYIKKNKMEILEIKNENNQSKKKNKTQ